MSKCQKVVRDKSNGYQRGLRCSKDSQHQDDTGRPLCKKHFNMWFEKQYGITYKEFQNQNPF